MIRMQYRLLIARPAADVFAMLVNFANFPRWKSHLVDWTVLTPGPLGVGSSCQGVLKVLGLRLAYTWTVTELQTDRLLTIRSTDGPADCEFSYRLVDLGTDTAVYYRAQGEPRSALLKLVAPLLAPVVRGILIADLLRLRLLLQETDDKPTTL